MRLFNITTLLLIFVSLVSCSNDDDINNDGGLFVDWANVSIDIYVSDVQGNNLVTQDYKDLTVTFKGTTYDIRDLAVSRANAPTFHGLRFIDVTVYPYYDQKKGNHLKFGEIDGSDDMDEDIVLNWADGTHNTIHYHCANHNEKELSCDRTWKLDGKSHDTAIFSFVK